MSSITLRFLAEPSTVNFGGKVHGGTVTASVSTVTWGNGSGAHRLILAHSRSNTIGTHAALVDGDQAGNIRFEGSDGTSFQTAAAIFGAVEGTVSSGVVPGKLFFQTADTGGTSRNRMVITNDGNVGIGTASPNAAALLDLTSTTKVLLPPRMTTAQRNAISSPPDGSFIYNTTTGKFQGRAGGAWVDLH